MSDLGAILLRQGPAAQNGGLIISTARSLSLVCALALAVLGGAWSPSAHATPLQPGFTDSVVFSGLIDPTDVAFAPDGRVFVAEKSGLIKAFPSLNATTSTIAADLRTQVYNFWDRGLLSIAIDPQFPTRPYLYAFYTMDAAIGGTAPRWGQPNTSSDPCPTPPGPTDGGCVASSRLSKLTLSGSTVIAEQPLVNDWCQQFPSHSAGGLAFGPDGMLYASGGDGASFLFTDYGQKGEPLFNPCGDPPVPVGGTQTAPTAQGGALRAQDILTASDPAGLDGSLIRIDPDTGGGALGNPMSTSLDANARRIVAAGMRNPFRFTFRPGTSEIYLADVGWGAWEEINHLPRADDATVDNFGWPCYEGIGRSPAYEGAGLELCEQLYNTPGSVRSPFFTYNHGSEVVAGEDCKAAGSSISGLAFYQGGNYPSAYAGALFFSDYSRGCTWVMFQRNGQPDPATRVSFLNGSDPVNIKIGPGGDLFVVDYNGSLRRIGYPGGNRAPTAVALAQPQAGALPLTVNFDGSGSTDPDPGDTLTYAWDLDGDGQYDDSTATKPTWTYTSAATVTARLRVTDTGGLTATDSVVIGAGNEPPHAQIDAPTTALRWAVGDVVPFSGQGSDPQQGTLGPGSMSWALVMRHCVTVDDCHAHTIQSYPGVSAGSFTAPDHEYPSYLELRLTVSDSGGLSDTATLRLDPRTVDLTFHTDPPGLTLLAGQQSAVTPFTRTVIVGSQNSIAAPTPQSLGGSWLGFGSWSDGGARSHDIVAPATATTYTATYKTEPVAPGLVLAYGFEETSGTVATDASPVKNNGTVNGATGTASGRFGRALSFDGVNDRVDVPDAASLDLSAAMTLEAWVRPTSNSGWRTALIKERGTTDLVYGLYSSSGAAPNTENVTNVKNVATGPGPLALNTWSHLASTYDGSALRLFVNGTQVATKAVSGAMPNTVNPLRIGGNAVWGEYFSGLIDEVRVYNRALSAVEIGVDMNAPVGPSAPGDTVAPSAPTNLTATGAVGKVTLGWSASTDNVGVSGYEVYRSTTTGFTPAAGNRVATTAATSYLDPVAAGTYHYRVKAIDAAGNLSAASAQATATATADPTPPASGLVLAYGFEETSGTVATDASPVKNNGTVNGATGTASGRFGRALSFDGVNDRVDVPDAASLDLSAAMTLEAWVRPTSNSGWRTALIKERGTTDLVYGLYSSSGAAPNTENVTNVKNVATGPGPLALNTWSHLASTYDGSALRLFVNGTQVATKAVSGAMPNTVNPLRIGGNAVWGEYFSGLIDEVRVYNRALSAVEIGVDMNAPVGPSAPGDTVAPSAPTNLTATGAVGKVTLGWSASTDNVGVSGYEVYRSTTTGFTPAAGNRVATTAATSYLDPVAAGTYHYRVKAIDAAGNLSAASAQATATATADPTPPASGLVLAYGFEETSGTVATDASPVKNNGTVNGATGTASGRFGRALSFDGVNDRVDVPDAASLDLSAAMTLEAWVRPTSNSGWRTALIKERGTTDLVYGLYSSSGAAPNTENVTNVKNVATGPGPLALNTWSHLASTYDGSALRLFVNGTQVATKAVSGAMPNTVNPLRIGGNAVWGEYFSGLIDEVRVYNRALSAAEIGVDMNAKVNP